MIRAMRTSDAPFVHTLFEQSLGYSCALELVQARIAELADEASLILLVHEDEEARTVDGFIHAARYDTLHDLCGWNIISLAVEPSHQGQGIGSALLCAFEDKARERGGVFVRLNSRTERTLAHGFYEHEGYGCDKVQKRFSKAL